MCALHANNAVLQRSGFESEDIITIEEKLNEEERTILDSNDLANNASSENMDEYGNFSIQVICTALAL